MGIGGEDTEGCVISEKEQKERVISKRDQDEQTLGALQSVSRIMRRGHWGPCDQQAGENVKGCVISEWIQEERILGAV